MKWKYSFLLYPLSMYDLYLYTCNFAQFNSRYNTEKIYIALIHWLANVITHSSIPHQLEEKKSPVYILYIGILICLIALTIHYHVTLLITSKSISLSSLNQKVSFYLNSFIFPTCQLYSMKESNKAECHTINFGPHSLRPWVGETTTIRFGSNCESLSAD